jgi:hypothetical protein
MVYLLHLTQVMPRGIARNGKPLQAGHYVGYTQLNLELRLTHHRNGTGARMLQVCRERGGDWVVARVWPDGDRVWERRIKRQKNAARLCPICAGEAALRRLKGTGGMPKSPPLI